MVAQPGAIGNGVVIDECDQGSARLASAAVARSAESAARLDYIASAVKLGQPVHRGITPGVVDDHDLEALVVQRGERGQAARHERGAVTRAEDDRAGRVAHATRRSRNAATVRS